MKYLHASGIEYHGSLKSGNCLIDGRWILKISDFGKNDLYRYYKIKPFRKRMTDFMYVAPEHLRKGFKESMIYGSQAGDVYSFSIIASEIITRKSIYSDEALNQETDFVLQKIKEKHKHPFRPKINAPSDVPEEAIKLIRRCWSEQPSERPSFRSIFSGMKSFVEKGYVFSHKSFWDISIHDQEYINVYSLSIHSLCYSPPTHKK